MSKALIDLLAKVEAGDMPPYSVFKEAYVKTEWQSLPSAHRDDAHNAYNGSLDAAKALHEAVLPDFGAQVDLSGAAWVYTPTRNAPPTNEVRVFIEDKPARVWLIAILKALIAKDQTND